MTPTVSVALVTRNGMATLPAVLEALAGQTREHELVAVDSASSDGTAELLAARADRVLTIAAEDFNHGSTRNRAIELASGEVVVLLVQDAVPAGPGWLDALVEPFADPGVAGAYARQLPSPGASRLTRWNLSRWIANHPEPRTSRVEDPEAWAARPPMERFLSAVFDNVCSAVRRSVWRDRPFPATAIAEDLEWSRDVLLAGHAIVYAPGAEVLHSHERSPRYELERTYLVHRRLYELFGVRTIPDRRSLWRAFAVNLRDHWSVLLHGAGPRPGPAEVVRTLWLAFAWPRGQYLGGRAAAEGRRLLTTGRL